ncbi:MAG TPA: response regulator [Clostridia bacterium]|nr:response regulator [Clostridia bacterium]
MARVLVVDDSLFARRKLKTILTQAGHEIVSEAANGIQAISEYEKYRPDLVTLDVTMPVMDGVTAVQRIIGNFPDARIIIVSASTQRNMVLSALESGARHYIIKQSPDNKVMEVVNSVLSDDGIPQKQQNEILHEKKQPAGMSDRPISIENHNGVFVVDVENVQADNLEQLNMTIKGLTAVKPLKVVFNFGIMEFLDNDSLDKLVLIMQSIKNSGGDIKVVSKNGSIVRYLRSKDIELVSSYYTEIADIIN